MCQYIIGKLLAIFLFFFFRYPVETLPGWIRRNKRGKESCITRIDIRQKEKFEIGGLSASGLDKRREKGVVGGFDFILFPLDVSNWQLGVNQKAPDTPYPPSQ
jgi:hypothetical protein